MFLVSFVCSCTIVPIVPRKSYYLILWLTIEFGQIMPTISGESSIVGSGVVKHDEVTLIILISKIHSNTLLRLCYVNYGRARSLTGKGNRKKLLPILKHKISVIISKLRKPLPTVDSTVRITVNRVVQYSRNLQLQSNEK